MIIFNIRNALDLSNMILEKKKTSTLIGIQETKILL